jgi:hypothetical protein
MSLSQRKKNKRAPKRSRPPWGDLFDGKPIERWFRRDDPLHGEAAEKDAIAQRDRRVARLADHFGASTYRELVLAIASKLDPALTIVDPVPLRTGKTAPKWRWSESQFLTAVEFLRKEADGKKVSWKTILKELQESHRDPIYQGISDGTLKARHHKIVQRRAKRTKRNQK